MEPPPSCCNSNEPVELWPCSFLVRLCGSPWVDGRTSPCPKSHRVSGVRGRLLPGVTALMPRKEGRGHPWLQPAGSEGQIRILAPAGFKSLLLGGRAWGAVAVLIKPPAPHRPSGKEMVPVRLLAQWQIASSPHPFIINGQSGWWLWEGGRALAH